uniref:Uncharacterized protein n=1 Tax=Arundo donax TaxID=35708 RepID=A0A0A9FJV8_ARUDO
MKSEYEKLVSRIENADEGSLVRRGDGEFAEFLGAERRNHPTIIKVETKLLITRVLWDMFANNPKVVLDAMCLLGFDDEVHSGFVQAPQFYGALKDDPFGNQMEVLFKKLAFGIAMG